MIPGPKASHQLNLALLRSGILHIKTVHTLNEAEPEQLQTVVLYHFLFQVRTVLAVSYIVFLQLFVYLFPLIILVASYVTAFQISCRDILEGV